MNQNAARWSAEARRTGIAMIGGSLLAGAGWYDASQTFLASKGGMLRHPSVLNWIEVPIGIVFFAGIYVVLALHWDWPLLGRKSSIGLDDAERKQRIRGAFVLKTLDAQRFDGEAEGINFKLRFTNGRSDPIVCDIKKISIVPDGGDGFNIEESRPSELLPDFPYILSCPGVAHASGDYPWKGEIEYIADYGDYGQMMFSKHVRLSYLFDGKNLSHDELLSETTELD